MSSPLPTFAVSAYVHFPGSKFPHPLRVQALLLSNTSTSATATAISSGIELLLQISIPVHRSPALATPERQKASIAIITDFIIRPGYRGIYRLSKLLWIRSALRNVSNSIRQFSLIWQLSRYFPRILFIESDTSDANRVELYQRGNRCRVQQSNRPLEYHSWSHRHVEHGVTTQHKLLLPITHVRQFSRSFSPSP